MTQNFIQQFLDETIQKAGFLDLAPDFALAYRDKLELLLAKKIGIEATSLLSDKAVEELAKMLEEKPNTGPANLFEFYAKNIPNFVDKMASIFQEFQVDYLAMVSKLGSSK